MADRVEHARKVFRVAMRQVTPVGQIHRQDLVAGLEKGEVDRRVGRCPRMRLHIGVLRPKKLFGPIDRRLLHHIHMLTAAVPAPARIALGILVRQTTALHLHHRRTGEVLRGDQFDVFRLPTMLLPHRFRHHRIGPRQIRPCGLAPSRTTQRRQPLYPPLESSRRKGAGDPGLHAGPGVRGTQLIRPQTKHIRVVPLAGTPGRFWRVRRRRPHFGKTVRRHGQTDSRPPYQHRPLDPPFRDRLRRRLGDFRKFHHIPRWQTQRGASLPPQNFRRLRQQNPGGRISPQPHRHLPGGGPGHRRCLAIAHNFQQMGNRLPDLVPAGAVRFAGLANGVVHFPLFRCQPGLKLTQEKNFVGGARIQQQQ